MKEPVTVFFTVDNNYAPYLAVAVNSIVKNSSSERKYRIIVLEEDISEENKAKISALLPKNFTIEFSLMSRGLDKISDRMGNRLRCDYFTLTIYYRLFIAEMYPEIEKAVYIDSDVVLLGDIGELYDTDIGEKLIGACRDSSVAGVPELCYYMEEGVGVPRNEYVNSGVLLMNLAALRKCRFEEHFLTLLSTYSFDTIAPDQDYINAICNGKIYYLDEKWDTMPNEGYAENTEAGLIHYNLFSKPWCYDGVQYGGEFWKYAYDSGFFEELCNFKKGYTEDKKRSDSSCLQLLIKRGGEIPKQEVTFKKMNEMGKKIRI
ncbi:MAG: glycosyltransferase family 8 protein [Clostridia bacterium]|nr:glycosyltransferase family 8 protein [Clostridia bacterium]MBR3806140.1 glycosyltransferase family 8 protein [Clostridia bacterium]